MTRRGKSERETKQGTGGGRRKRRGGRCSLRVLDSPLSWTEFCQNNTSPQREKEQVLFYSLVLDKTAVFLSLSIMHLHFQTTCDSESKCEAGARLHWEGHHKRLQKHMDVPLQIMPNEGTVGLNSSGTKGTKVERIRECPILPRAPTYSPRLGSN